MTDQAEHARQAALDEFAAKYDAEQGQQVEAAPAVIPLPSVLATETLAVQEPAIPANAERAQVEDEEADDDQQFTNPTIQVVHSVKGYAWGLQGATGKRLCCAPRIYPTLREMKADLAEARAVLVGATYTKLY